MSVGLFLDVDNTLTKGFIQGHFADRLGCREEYDRIEQGFQTNRVSADTFGQEIIDLFAKKGFTADRAEREYASIPKHDWTDQVLRLPVERYLVSSGPNYYIHHLAREYGIDVGTNVLCSSYFFDGPGGCISRCNAVNDTMKARWVGLRAGRHDLTVGVGDSEVHDGPFLANCTIPVIVPHSTNDSYFSALTFGLVYTTLEQMTSSAVLGRRPPLRSKETRVFIGSSTEDLEIARALHAGLAEFCEPNLWTFDFGPSEATIEALEKQLTLNDWAVLIAGVSDRVSARGTTAVAPRDNVLFELGLFMGALGRRHCFLLMPHNEDVKLPSDLFGVSHLTYARRSDGDIGQALVGVVDQLRKIIVQP